MVVYVSRVHVRDYHTLEAGEVFRELDTDLMRRVEVQRIVRGERLDDVVVGAAVRLVELFLDRLELIQRGACHTVDAGDETVHRFLAVGNVVEDALQTTRDRHRILPCFAVAAPAASETAIK